MSYVASIDAGTSSVRVIIYNKNGETIASEQQKLTMLHPKPGFVEQKPFEIIDKIYECMNKILLSQKPSINKSQIKCIGITNQRETTLVWDKLTSKPVYNAIVWIDNRSNEQCQQILKENNTNNKDFLPNVAYLCTLTSVPQN